MRRQLRPGEPVDIIGVAHEKHAHMIGKRGLVRKYIKARGIYSVEFYPYARRAADANRWEAYPHNLRAVNDGAIGA